MIYLQFFTALTKCDTMWYKKMKNNHKQKKVTLRTEELFEKMGLQLLD